MKKILIISVIVIVVVLAAGFFVFKFLTQPENLIQTEQPNNQNNTEEVPQVQLEVGGVQTEGENNQGGLIICSDKCGDGVCQKSDPECKDNMNCICPETPQDCPQDCK